LSIAEEEQEERQPMTTFMYALKPAESRGRYPRQFKMFLDFLKNLFELEREKKKELDITIGQHTDNVTYYLRCNNIDIIFYFYFLSFCILSETSFSTVSLALSNKGESWWAIKSLSNLILDSLCAETSAVTDLLILGEQIHTCHLHQIRVCIYYQLQR
jgi:hypothetical protein